MKLVQYALPFVVALPLVATPVSAQTYPSKPIRIVVPFSPGGGTDILARLLAPRLSERLGQPLVVDNRLGAAGTVATEYTARSAPDGHTIQVGSTSEIGIGATLHSKTSYNVLRDLSAVAALVSNPMILVTHPSLPVRNVKDLIALARARPGELNYGSAGAGTGNHMCGELFRYLAKIEITHVPYKGAAPVLADIVGGQMHMMFSTLPAATGLLHAGRLKALAVSTTQRHRTLPEVPTMIEAGVPGYEVEYWYGFFMPAGVPAAIQDRIADETNALLRNAETIAALQARGMDPISRTRKEFETFVRRDIERWAPAVKASGAAGL